VSAPEEPRRTSGAKQEAALARVAICDSSAAGRGDDPGRGALTSSRARILRVTPILFLLCSCFSPTVIPANDEGFTQASKAIVSGEIHGRKVLGKRNMNTAGQIAVTLAALIGFGRLFLADEGDSHRLSGLLILAGFVGKIALSI
jgi:hypothetical protein